MIRINLITVGKLKEKYWRDACAEYAKRLSAFCKLEIVELNESRLSDNPSQKEIENALSNEAKAMMPYIDKKSTANIAMCIEGKQLSSVELSDKTDSFALQGYSTVNFIIGSSFGIADEIKEKCQLRLSMSKMTFPHQLARVMLLEQIYRAFQIQNNTKYHK
ncbi:MAG: 23S rRNA (pseudouridine(1915)-N(3))-methyltransferase RlmH [Ruminococcus sp.]|nr:23S rRNA (pseudouridine(1915)-N(3))-methyltransferase RlmH [Ruminococcus sp.]